MPGAYAHISMASRAVHPDNFKKMGLDTRTAGRLLTQVGFFQLGAISPDMPYLVGWGRDADATAWADAMHKEVVAERIASGVEGIRRLPADRRDKALAWLLGFVEHVVYDVFMHPIVNAIAGGPYSETTKSRHQLCEMHQDVFIVKEVFSISQALDGKIISAALAGLHALGDSDALAYDIRIVFDHMLQASTPKLYAGNVPIINDWFDAFVKTMKLLEEHDWLVAFGRHVGVKTIYPRYEDLDDSFLHGLETPDGRFLDYSALFDLGYANVLFWWERIIQAVLLDKPFETSRMAGWNLDTGNDAKRTSVFWRKA